MSAERFKYLNDLAENYGIPFDEVYIIAETLGECEDHDGLLTFLDDYELMISTTMEG